MPELVPASALLALLLAIVALIVTATHLDTLARQSAAQLSLSLDVGKRLLVLLDQVDVARVDVLQARVEDLERQHAPTNETRGAGAMVPVRASGVAAARSARVIRNIA